MAQCVFILASIVNKLTNVAGSQPSRTVGKATYLVEIIILRLEPFKSDNTSESCCILLKITKQVRQSTEIRRDLDKTTTHVLNM